MSISLLIFILIYLAGLIATFYLPVFGVLTYIFEWHNHPPFQWWGKSLPDIRYSFLIALLTLISTFLNFKKLKPLKRISFGPAFWLVLFVIWMYFVTIGWSLVPHRSMDRVIEMFKYTLFYYIMVFLIRERKHFTWLLWVILLNVANFGRIAYQRGHNRYLGVIAPNAMDENTIAAYVVSTMPFFGVKFIEGSRKVKLFVLLVAPFLINLVILANSRGAFVALLCVAFYALITFPVRDKFKIIGALIFGVILLLNLANEQFWQRQKTIENYEQEESAMSRIYLWKGGLKMMRDYPLGVGGEGPEQLAFDYYPELTEIMLKKGPKTLHNTFLLAGVEWGIPGLILFLLFLIHTFKILRGLRRKIKNYSGMEKSYFYELIAIELALVGILVAGFFTNRLYAEAIYWYSAFGVIMKNIIENEIEEKYRTEENPVYHPSFSA